MTDTNAVLLYVADAPASASFYTRLLGLKPVETSPTFAMFILPSGLGLGLWGRNGVDPRPTTGGGGSEIGFKVSSSEEVDQTFDDWRGRGASIALTPTDLDFGRSFVALDPDGHRLRVYHVGEEM